MTKKDFELIARVINDAWSARALNQTPAYELSKRMADALGWTHPKFDRDRFLEACGFPQR